MSHAVTVLAAGEAPPFLGQIAGLVVGAAVVAYLAFRLGFVPIVGFLLAGVLIGPSQLGLVGDRALADAAAQVGVILLLFTIGLEFSLDRLLRIRRVIFLGGGLQVLLSAGAATGVLALAGVGWRPALFTGLLVSLSSTAIVLKLLGERAETNRRHGQVALGVLLFQDLAVVLMVLMVPALGGHAGTPGDFALALVKAAAIVAAVVVVARRLMPRLLEVVARTCSPEVFLLSVVAVCFGTAYATSLAGVSVSLGAFLAGLLVSESRFDQQALGEVLPLQIVFSALFFVSVGMLLDAGFLVDHLPAVLAAVLAVFALKALTTVAAARALGERIAVAVAAGLLLAQLGEFSFVLARAGTGVGLSPAGLGTAGEQGFIAATVLLMVATPWLAAIGARAPRWLPAAGGEGRVRVEAGTEPDADSGVAEGLDGHVIVAGYGRAARSLTAAFQRGGVPQVVVTLSPDGAAEADERGLPVLLGDPSRTRTMREAGIERASFVAILDDEPPMAARVAGVAHALNPAAKVVVRTRYRSDTGEIAAAGATHVVSAEGEALARISEKLLDAYDVAPEQIELHLSSLRAPSAAPVGHEAPPAAAGRAVVDTEHLVEPRLAPGACEHAGQARAVLPSARGCEECLRDGTSWVHLRLCLVCGHVGCCDSSPQRHARRHWEGGAHAIMRSAEPGEEWAWCFADERMLELADEPAPARG
jgi:CPA2 family monovalent cation:H+ antiporter-2